MRIGFDMLGFAVSSLQHIGWKSSEMGQGMITVLFCVKFSGAIVISVYQQLTYLCSVLLCTRQLRLQ